MSKSNPTFRALNRIFDRSDTLVYFVDRNEEIAFANRATSEWVDVDLDELKSARVVFSSATSSNPTKEQLQGLCPPPELLEPQTTSGPHSIWIWKTSEGVKSFCQASAFQIFENESLIGILMVAAADTATTEPPSTSIEVVTAPDKIHAAVAKIQNEINRQFSNESLIGTSPFAQRARRQVKIAAD